jgi:hypothetical protein
VVCPLSLTFLVLQNPKRCWTVSTAFFTYRSVGTEFLKYWIRVVWISIPVFSHWNLCSSLRVSWGRDFDANCKPRMRLIYFVLFGLGRLTKWLFEMTPQILLGHLICSSMFDQYLFTPLLLRYWCPVYPFNELSLSGGLFQHRHINLLIWGYQNY